MRTFVTVAASLLLLGFVTGTGGAKKIPIPQIAGPAQQPGQPAPRPSISDQDPGAPDVFKDRLSAQAARSRNSERHKRMVADTTKLLQLSTELKDEIDKTTKDELSVQVIQKAAEIEKLAHDVKERMKGP